MEFLLTQKLVLTETLDDITSGINVEALLSQEFDHKQNVNYQLIEGQEKMSSLALKSQKASVLPTLSGFYSYGVNGMGDKVSESAVVSEFNDRVAAFSSDICQRSEIQPDKKSPDKSQ